MTQSQQERQEDTEATIRMLDNALIGAQHVVDDLGGLIAQVKAVGGGIATNQQLKELQEMAREARKHSNPIRGQLDTAHLCVETFVDRERARLG